MLVGIRKFSRSIFAKILFSLIAISFVIWGLNASMLDLGNARDVAEIGQQTVSPAELDRAFQRDIQNMRRVFGPNFDRSQAIQMGMLNNTVEGLVSQKLLLENARELGIGISNDKVRETVFATESFKNETTGQFDREQFLQVLYSNGYTEPEFIEGVRGDLMGQQIITSLGGAVAAPAAMTRQIAAWRNEQRAGQFFELNADDLGDVATPGDATLRTYHQENPAPFTAPETRSSTLVLLTVDQIAETIGVSDDEILDAYNQRLAEFQTPEKRAVEQILFAPNEKETASDAVTAIRNGADFMSVAIEQAGMTESLVKLGEFTADNILPDLRDAVFNLPEGEVSDPVETALGWHILRVSKITPETVKGLDEVRDAITRDVKRQKAADQIFDIAATLDDELGAGTPLDEAAANVNARLIRIENVEQGADLGNDIADSNEINAKIFELAEGEESFLEETLNGDRYVVRVDTVTPSTLRPFEDVREDVLAAWTQDEKHRLLVEQAEQLASDINAGGQNITTQAENLGHSVVETGLTRRTGEGLAPDVSPAVAATLFQLEKSKAQVVQSDDRILVVTLTDINEAQIDGLATDPVSTELRNALNQDLLSQYLNYLRDDISVTVNNSVVNNLYAPQPAAN
ncbi:SurA N-terminal domain-containing protein [Thalassospira sp.]|uniref:SurA N-terminal domain-containing protein n=1 Tax=Thalassospira sp. TaxID=1912094 RepID=UPI00273419FA|nr:SurA N-terminal domain-containing protein [Thalassospira sp.]MDP2697800.1 SurA N-terminal domain-containing protein [Thalassospira sp.]